MWHLLHVNIIHKAQSNKANYIVVGFSSLTHTYYYDEEGEYLFLGQPYLLLILPLPLLTIYCFTSGLFEGRSKEEEVFSHVFSVNISIGHKFFKMEEPFSSSFLFIKPIS